MLDAINSLFEDTQTIGIIPESEHNNHIITESVILDRVGGDKAKLAKVLAEVGQYAVRDNLLESAQITESFAPVDECKPCECTSVLATAKEANDTDYQTYCKAVSLAKQMMCNMKAKYGTNAAARVADINTQIDNTPRLVNAINTLNGACDR